MANFKTDLDFSRIYELRLIENLSGVDRFEQSPSDVSFTPYDIKIFTCENREETYEVKVDRYCNGYNGYKSSNIAIEYKQFRGGVMKPSGISKSKAQFWGIFCPFNNQEYELFVIDRKILKKMINDQEFLMNKKTNDNSFFVLFKKEQIKNKCILYKHIKTNHVQ
jgi:hypothetical protein